MKLISKHNAEQAERAARNIAEQARHAAFLAELERLLLGTVNVGPDSYSAEHINGAGCAS